MKIIEVTIVLGTSRFTSKCTSASEAFDVVRDAYAGWKGVTMEPSDADDWMESLIGMMRGKGISRSQGALYVRAVEAET